MEFETKKIIRYSILWAVLLMVFVIIEFSVKLILESLNNFIRAASWLIFSSLLLTFATMIIPEVEDFLKTQFES